MSTHTHTHQIITGGGALHPITSYLLYEYKSHNLHSSMILSRRPKDDESQDGFTKWPFMTTHTWAENPRGVWKLFVIFDSDEPQYGTLFEWTLMLHGSKVRTIDERVVRVNASKRIRCLERMRITTTAIT